MYLLRKSKKFQKVGGNTREKYPKIKFLIHLYFQKQSFGFVAQNITAAESF